MTRTVLFQSDNLRVVARCEFSSPQVVITFASFSDSPTLDQPGFGEDFLAGYRIDAVHVICSSNRWYQYPEMAEALATVAAATAAYATRVAYGSSMGAYAAINFAKQHRANRIIAISPQFSVDSAKLPWEERWYATTRSIRFICDDMDLAQWPAEIYAIHDPRNQDGRHVALIRKRGPVRDIAVPFGGHPAGGMLVEAGLMSGTVLALIEDRFDPAAFDTALRAARRRTPAYLVGLSEALAPSKTRLKVKLAARAVQLRPLDAAYHLYHGTVLIAASDWTGAEQALREALALAPTYSAVHRQLSVALECQGRYPEAIGIAREAVLHAERDTPTLTALGRLLVKWDGTPPALEDAVSCLQRAVAADPDSRNAQFYLSIALMRQKRFREAVAAARAAHLAAPKEARLRRHLAWLRTRHLAHAAASLVRRASPA